MNNSLKAFLQSSKSVLILLPTRPFLDQVAAGLALYLSLKNEREVNISSPSDMLVEFNRLIGVDKITNELGNKNLVISFTNYKPGDVEKVSYDVEDGEFRLTVVPKSDKKAPTKEQVNVGFAGISSDAVILIGGGNSTHFPALESKDLEGVPVAHIGTRSISLSNLSNVVSLAKPGSGVSEVVATLIKGGEFPINADIATNLIAGIEQGSNMFSGGSVTAQTFEIFAELMKSGGVRGQLTPAVQSEDFPQGSIPKIEDVVPPPEEEPAKTSPAVDWYKPKIYKSTKIN